MKTKKAEFNKSKMVVLTAGTNNQFSNAYFEKGHRLFSYYLTKAILERPTLDIDSIYKDVAVKVKDESYKMGDLKVQEPQIEGNSKLGI
jgi:metal-dependent HD superfamily phosphatase/phosphodiesterase